jgi:hypothetical protein
MLAPGGEITILDRIQHVALTTVCGVTVLGCVTPFIAHRARIVAWGEDARDLVDAGVHVDVELNKLVAVEQRKRKGNGGLVAL